jgi:acyl carrier protein
MYGSALACYGRQSAEERLVDTKAEILGILQKRLKPGVVAAEDKKLVALEIESLDLIELMFELEDRFRIQLPQNSEALQEATVGDLLAWVEQEIAKAAVPAPGAGG